MNLLNSNEKVRDTESNPKTRVNHTAVRPHIQRMAKLGQWVCANDSWIDNLLDLTVVGVGDTPREAYQGWCLARESHRNYIMAYGPDGNTKVLYQMK